MPTSPKPVPEKPSSGNSSQISPAVKLPDDASSVKSSTGTEQPADTAARVDVSAEPEVQRSEKVTPTTSAGGVSYLYLLAAFVIVTAGVRMAQEILQLLLLSIFLAVVGVPVYAWLVQKKVASWLSLLIVISGLVMSTLIVFWIVMTSMADFTSRQDHYAEQLRERTRPLQGMLERLIPETPALGRSVLVPESAEEPLGLTPPVQDDPHPGPAADIAEADPSKDSASNITRPFGSANGSEVAEPSDEASSSAEENRLASSQLSGEELPLNPDEPSTSALMVQASEPESMFDPQSENAAAWLQPRKVMVPPLSRRGWRELIASQFDPARVISMAASLALSVSQILSNTMLILLTVTFILLEASTFPKKLRMAFGDHRDTQERYRLIVARIRSYLVIKTVMSLLTGILIACWLWLFGVPYAGLWGMLAQPPQLERKLVAARFFSQSF